MNRTVPAHLQTDPEKYPGQIVNPINTDLMDDMGKYAAPTPYNPHGASAASLLTRRGNPLPLDYRATTVTWDDHERNQVVMQAVVAIRKALARGAKLEDITRLL